MATMNEVLRIEQFLVRGEQKSDNKRGCLQLVAKVRGLLAAESETPAVRRKLEQILGRFAGAEF